jgi:transcription initiation factor TFIID subunit TAF12
MFLNHQPCIDISECKSFGGLSHHPVEEKTNTKKGITKKYVMLQHWKYWMLVEIKGYAKLVQCQLEKHMGYDDKNRDEINSNGKHQ